MEIRIGNGYDIHKLVKNKAFIIGNICIPFKKGFKAHSDGDVLIHSIIDSLLGAINEGDIGCHFPDNDPAYKDIDSSILLKETMALVKNKGFYINNLDSTIICEKPKLKKYIPVIIDRLSEIMNLDKDRISIKAKTKEKLDSTGKGKSVEVLTVSLLIKNK